MAYRVRPPGNATPRAPSEAPAGTTSSLVMADRMTSTLAGPLVGDMAAGVPRAATVLDAGAAVCARMATGDDRRATTAPAGAPISSAPAVQPDQATGRGAQRQAITRTIRLDQAGQVRPETAAAAAGRVAAMATATEATGTAGAADGAQQPPTSRYGGRSSTGRRSRWRCSP